MNAERWQELLMNRLYGEITPEQVREFDAHIQGNPEAMREWEEFEGLRDRLAGSAESVPAIPVRGWVAPPRRWGMFAAGFAAAAGIFCAGFLIGLRPVADGEPTQAAIGARELEAGLASLGIEPADLRKSIAAQRELQSRTDVLSAKLDRLPEDAAGGSDEDPLQLTREEFEAGLTRIMNRIDYERQRDLEFVLNEITSVDQRQSTRIDTNRQALQFALQAVSTPAEQ